MARFLVHTRLFFASALVHHSTHIVQHFSISFAAPIRLQPPLLHRRMRKSWRTIDGRKQQLALEIVWTGSKGETR